MNLSDLRTALKERREDFSPSDAKLDRKINQSYLDICSRRKWGWLRRQHTVDTFPKKVIDGADRPYDPGPPVSGADSIVVTTGSTGIGFSALDLPGPTIIGKKIIITGTANPDQVTAGFTSFKDGASYRVINQNEAGITGVLDRPYRGTTFPWLDLATSIRYYGTATIVYDEVALPLGTETLVEASVFDGASTYPMSIEGIRPGSMMSRNENVFGRPTQCSVVHKEPIYRPRVNDADPMLSLTGNLAEPDGRMSGGATYKYWYTYVDKQTRAESALSAPVSVTLSSTDNSVVVAFSDDLQRTDYELWLYRSAAGGDKPYLLRDYANFLKSAMGSYTDQAEDDYLGPKGPQSASTMFLTLYPAPDAVYQIHVIYQADALPLDGDSDRPLFESTYTNVLLDGAEYLMLTSSDEQARASSVRASYEAGIQRMVMQDRMNFQQRVLVGRGGRRLRGNRTWWYGSLGT